LDAVTVFIVVDRLDEYYPLPDHHLLVRNLKALAKIPNLTYTSIKPWQALVRLSATVQE